MYMKNKYILHYTNTYESTFMIINSFSSLLK